MHEGHRSGEPAESLGLHVKYLILINFAKLLRYSSALNGRAAEVSPTVALSNTPNGRAAARKFHHPAADLRPGRCVRGSGGRIFRPGEGTAKTPSALRVCYEAQSSLRDLTHFPPFPALKRRA